MAWCKGGRDTFGSSALLCVVVGAFDCTSAPPDCFCADACFLAASCAFSCLQGSKCAIITVLLAALRTRLLSMWQYV